MSRARLVKSDAAPSAAASYGDFPYRKPLSAADKAALKHRSFVGGMWEELGRLQIEFLRSRGLRPEHHLLDVGCGCLRGGVHFVRYLEQDHYVGVDGNPSLLDAGLYELEQAGLDDKGSVLIESDRFEFQKAERVFDQAIAVSVLTHIFINQIARCLFEMKRVLKSGGTFYASYFEAPSPMCFETLAHKGGSPPTYYDQNPFHISTTELAALAEGAGFAFERIGDWGHPRDQMMAAFTR